MADPISRRSVPTAIVALWVAAMGDDPLALAVDAHRRLRGHIKAFSDTNSADGHDANHPVEVEFNAYVTKLSTRGDFSISKRRALRVSLSSLRWSPISPSPMNGPNEQVTAGGM